MTESVAAIEAILLGFAVIASESVDSPAWLPGIPLLSIEAEPYAV